MPTLPLHTDPTDIPVGATIRRPTAERPFVTMSSRSRWGKCALSAVLPQVRTVSGPQAEEGTAAHSVGEWTIKLQFQHPAPGTEPIVTPPPGLYDFDYSPAGVEAWRAAVRTHAQAYAANAATLFGDCDQSTRAVVEQKIDGVVIHGVRVYVVADVILDNMRAKRVVVGDYKYGRGPVGVGDLHNPNPQVAGTLAVLDTIGMHDPGTTFGAFVYQPRTHAGEPWQVLAPLSLDWVREQRRKLDAELAAVAAAARNPLGTAPAPGDHCKYCPSVRWCPAAADYGATALAVEAGTRTVADLTPAEVMAQWTQRSAFKAYEDDLRERVRILAEQADPAVTVQRRKGNAIWASPDKVAELLMLTGRADLLQPPGIERVREAGVPADQIDPLISRAPDVLTYKASAGKDITTAQAAFAKYLPKGTA